MKINSNLNSLRNILPEGLKKEEHLCFSMEEMQDTMTFAGRGLQAMEEQQDALNAIRKGETYIEAIAGYNKGSWEACLARIAMKAIGEGDSFLANIVNKEMVQEIPEEISGRDETLSIVFDALKALYEATLETIASGVEGSIGLMAAHAGLKAMKEIEKGLYPVAPALAAEPFIIAIAECKRENPKAGYIADFLHEELPAYLTSPSNAAYKVALEAMTKGCSEPTGFILSKIGLEVINSIPGHERDVAPLAKSVLEKLSEDMNPLVAEVAETIVDGIKSLEKDEKKDEIVSLYKISFKELEHTAGRTVQEAAEAGVKMMDSLSKSDRPLPPKIISKTGEAYLNFINEYSETDIYHAFINTVKLVHSDDEDGITALALYKNALELLKMDKGKAFSVPSFMNMALRTMKNLEEGNNTASQIKIARIFIRSACDGYEIEPDVRAVLDLPVDSEHIVHRHVEILNKLKECTGN